MERSPWRDNGYFRFQILMTGQAREMTEGGKERRDIILGIICRKLYLGVIQRECLCGVFSCFFFLLLIPPFPPHVNVS